MRTKNFALTDGYGFCGSVYYPDEICFAYNPNTLTISFTNTDEIFNYYLDKVTVFVGTFRIDCALYGDRATIKLSNIFKVFFNDIATKRVLRIPVVIIPTGAIDEDNPTETAKNIVFNETFTVVYGGLSMGQRCNIYGAFPYNEDKPYHHRKIRWFKNLPQYISLLRVAYTRTVAATPQWGKGGYWLVQYRPKVGAVSYSYTDPTSSGASPAPPRFDPTQYEEIPSFNGKTAVEKAQMYHNSLAESMLKGKQYTATEKLGDITGSIVVGNMEVDKIDFDELAGYAIDKDTQNIDDKPIPWTGGNPWEPTPVEPSFPTGDDGDDGDTGQTGDDNDGTPNNPDGGSDNYGDNDFDPSHSGDDENDGQTPSQADSGLPESEEEFMVVYFPLLHKFYGYDKENQTFVSTWEAQGNYEDAEQYNNYESASEFEAITDKEYCYGGKIAYIKENWTLNTRNFGNGEPVGMIDINPAIAFKDMLTEFPSGRVRVLMSWTPILRINRTRPPYNYNPVFEDSIVDVEICPRTCGYYLRWIDSIGYSQFFLFDKGTVENEVERSEDVRFNYVESNGLDFEARHNLSVKLERKVTCCAMFLDDELFAEVVTIASAAHVDLYLGKDSAGNQIWEPVTIENTSVVHDPNKALNNVEITIVRMEQKSQRL